jgi:hypothetical protein
MVGLEHGICTDIYDSRPGKVVVVLYMANRDPVYCHIHRLDFRECIFSVPLHGVDCGISTQPVAAEERQEIEINE